MGDSRGVFITCEGGEGVGKSSFLEGLLLALKNKGVQAVGTREPGGSPVAEAIRPIFNHPPKDDPLTPEAEFFLISAARIQHVVNKIEPKLHAGVWVICDRFADSSIVYQGILGGLSRSFLDTVIHHSTFHLTPHTTFLLDCPVDVSLARVKKRSLDDPRDTRYDRADRVYHVKIREAYLQLAEEFQNRYVILDATASTDVLVQKAIQKLEERSAFVKKKHRDENSHVNRVV
jgi:dTMP kinase